MATTVGRIVLDVDADGRLLERRIRKIGRQGGVEAGKEFTKEWDKQTSTIAERFRQQVLAKAGMDAKDGGKAAGISFSDAFESSVRGRLNRITRRLVEALQSKGAFSKFAEEAGGTREALERLRIETKELYDAQILTENQMRSINLTARNYAKSIDANTAAHRALTVELEQQNEVTRRAQQEQAELARFYKEVERSSDALLSAEERRYKTMVRLVEEGRRLNISKERQSQLDGLLLRASLDLELSMSKFNQAQKEANKESGSFFSRWKTLPRGFRRFTFFTALFASLGEEIAVLGSAAGSSLAVVAGSLQQLLSAAAAGGTIALGALASVGVGIGVIVTAFRGFTGELSDLTPNARAAAEAFRAFGKELGTVRETIQENFFEGLAGPLEELFTRVLPILQEGLGGIATALNAVFGDLIARLSSDQGLANIAAILEIIRQATEPLFTAFVNLGSAISEIFIIAGPSIQRFAEYLQDITASFEAFTQSEDGRREIAGWLARGEQLLAGFLDGVLNIGRALGNIFDAGQPQIEKFNRFLGDVIERFADWTGSLEGQNALEEWFSNGERVMTSVLDLLVDIGGVLNRLVDEDAISRFEDTISSLQGALPGIESLLGLLGELNVFGIIAEVLEQAFVLLQPIFDALAPIATILSTIITSFSNLNTLLAPFLTAILAPMQILWETLAIVITTVAEALEPLRTEFDEMGILLNETLIGAIDTISQAFADLILDVLGVETGTQTAVDYLRDNLVPIIETKVVPAIDEFARNTAEMIEVFRTEVLPVLRDQVVPFIINDLLPAVGRVIGIFDTWRTAADRVADRLRPLIDLARDVARAFGLIPDISGAVRVSDPQQRLPRRAAGGIATQTSIAGEAGPEIIIPLTRPLSQVDPSVRELAAIARGMYGNAGRFDGPVGQRGGAYIAPGAITVVSPYADPANVAMAALNELVEMIG